MLGPRRRLRLSHCARRRRATAEALTLYRGSSRTSRMAPRMASASESNLCTSIPALRCERTVRAHSNWSMKKGWHTMGTPLANASRVLFIPQWDRKHFTRSQRRTSFWLTKASTRQRSCGRSAGRWACRSLGRAQSTRQEPPSRAFASRSITPLKPFTMVPKATYTTGSLDSSKKSQSRRSALRQFRRAARPTCSFPAIGSGRGSRGHEKNSWCSLPLGFCSIIHSELGKTLMGFRAGLSFDIASPSRISIGSPIPLISKRGL
mmetsp:Transcript_107536/g.332118  ORF Transcript_107536/g.332118 Transcript_107536/m.332118 type:complete len:263 (+) Transcript_107536:367-1155(+)